MKFISYHWQDCVTAVGMILTIFGTFLMGAKYTNVLPCQIPRVIVSALWRGDYAKKSAVIGEQFTGDKSLSFLQGLALVAVGFVFQIIPILVNMFGQWSPVG